ncbi:MAG: Ni/Fe hydrogenase subunit alpha [Candidatus Brocadiia bacterium]
MSSTIDINVHHITRVEGHGNIEVSAKDGEIHKVEWQVPEAPRFFEAMVRGRSYEDIQTVVSRICGICSCTHSLAATKAIEDAMDIEISEQSEKLRLLLLHGEQIESHVLHVGYLVAPDLLGAKSVVPLTSSHPELVKTIIRLHKLGNDIMEVIGGRMTHPVALRPGGWGKLPTEDDLRYLKSAIEARVPDLKAVVEAVGELASGIPDFDRPTEYIGLTDAGYYTFYHGDIGSTDTDDTLPVQKFESVANEYVSPQSTAKWTKWHRESYAVGALARYNINADQLLPLAQEVAEQLGLEPGCCNPYMNNVAQVVECAQVAEHALQLIDELLETGIEPEAPDVTPKAGWGVGCCEAPRGILFHSYEFDDDGVCVGSNITIPTNQNHGNIQKDFEALVPEIIDQDQEDVRLMMEMLVRAYDPCISCSTHYLDVEFV